MTDQRGNSSNVFLFIVALVLVAAVIGYFRVNGLSRFDAEPGQRDAAPQPGSKPAASLPLPKDGNGQAVDLYGNACGITIQAPNLQAETLTFPLHLRGFVNGCGWVPVPSRAGTVTVEDGDGVAITLPIDLVLSEAYGGTPAAFSIWFSLPSRPRYATGTLVFRSNNQFPTGTDVIRVPVAFR